MRPAIRLPHAAAAVLLAVGSSQGADALTFVRLVRQVGPAAEANAWVAAQVVSGHLAELLVAKAGVVALVVGVVVLLATRYPVAGAAVATFATVTGLVGAWSNVLVLLHPYVT